MQGTLYTELFYAIIPTLFLLFCYPYICHIFLLLFFFTVAISMNSTKVQNPRRYDGAHSA